MTTNGDPAAQAAAQAQQQQAAQLRQQQIEQQAVAAAQAQAQAMAAAQEVAKAAAAAGVNIDAAGLVTDFNKFINKEQSTQGNLPDTINGNWSDSPRSMLPIYKEIFQGGLRIWVFSGDTDSVVPLTATRYSIDALGLPTTTDWYPWYDDNQEVGGWSQVYEGLTLVTVRGAGHEVALHRPRQALILFQNFLQGKPMPGQTTNGTVA